MTHIPVTVWQTEFTKADGSQREIKYIVTDDMPEPFKQQEIKGTRKKVLPWNSKLVWDVEANAFRTINTEKLKYAPVICGYADLDIVDERLVYTAKLLESTIPAN